MTRRRMVLSEKGYNNYYCDNYCGYLEKQRNEEWCVLRRVQGQGIVWHALIAHRGIPPSLAVKYNANTNTNTVANTIQTQICEREKIIKNI